MAFSKLTKSVFSDRPRRQICQECGKDIEPQSVETEDGLRYLNLPIMLCPSCQVAYEKKDRIVKELAAEAEQSRKLANVPSMMLKLGAPFPDADSSDFNQNDLDMVKRIGNSLSEGKNSMIISSVGTGKSYYASYIMRKMMEYYIDSPDWFGYYRMRQVLVDIRKTFDDNKNFEGNITRDISRKKFLFLELSDHQSTMPRQRSEFTANTLFDIVDPRYLRWFNGNKKQATLYISTIGQQLLSQLYDDSVISRIYDMCDNVFKLQAENRRYRGKDKTEIINLKGSV